MASAGLDGRRRRRLRSPPTPSPRPSPVVVQCNSSGIDGALFCLFLFLGGRSKPVGTVRCLSAPPPELAEVSGSWR